MQTLVKTFLVVLAFISLNANAQKTVQKAVIKTAISCEHCKMCDSCGGLLEKTLLKNIGIQMIDLDEKAMTITVIYNTKKTDLAAIRTAISKLGYDADSIKADVEGYEKLDLCCKA